MVVKGDYEATEHLLHRAVDNGLFGPYIYSQDYVPEWSRILPCIDEDPCHRPGMRGGHQMCIDVREEELCLRHMLIRFLEYSTDKYRDRLSIRWLGWCPGPKRFMVVFSPE